MWDPAKWYQGRNRAEPGQERRRLLDLLGFMVCFFFLAGGAFLLVPVPATHLFARFFLDPARTILGLHSYTALGARGLLEIVSPMGAFSVCLPVRRRGWSDFRLDCLVLALCSELYSQFPGRGEGNFDLQLISLFHEVRILVLKFPV